MLKKIISLTKFLLIPSLAFSFQENKYENLFKYGANDDFADIFLIEQEEVEMNRFGMRSFTGIEYEKISYSDHNNQNYLSYILLDGAASINRNWGLIYKVKQIHKDEKDTDEKPKNIIELKPSYNLWVNENFAYGLKFGTEIDRGEEQNDKFFIEPNVFLKKDKHQLYVPIIQGVKGRDGSLYYESEIMYLYNFNQRINLGTKLFYKNEKDDFSFEEKAVRPFVQFLFKNNSFLELKLEVGQTEIHDGSGYDYINYVVFSEIPVTKNLSFLGEFSYRDWNQKNPNSYSWGDKNTLFIKSGITWSF